MRSEVEQTLIDVAPLEGEPTLRLSVPEVRNAALGLTFKWLTPEVLHEKISSTDT